MNTIKMAKAKTLGFGITEAIIKRFNDGFWGVSLQFSIPDMPDEPLWLETFRGDLREFKTADSAFKAVREITLDRTQITMDWEGRDNYGR
jgi:hypothetical protein